MGVTVAARLAREFRRLMSTRPARVDWPGGVVSFTFDDFPRSAWTEGGAILEQHDCRGTYYAAMGLAGTENHLGPMFHSEDLRDIHARGHEIACHTFSHLDCSRAPAAEIAVEIDRNGAALSRGLDGAMPINFAYPYGAVSLAAKRALAPRFVACRGTGRGINHGAVDLADLLSTAIYDQTFDQAALRRLIDGNRERGGWLIFYTHDVRETPSDFGCTPLQLKAVVARAARAGAVLPVGDVLARLGLADGWPRPARQSGGLTCGQLE